MLGGRAGGAVVWEERVRIATWNVNSIKARLDYVLGWLAERAPDVVCLQELKLDEAGFPALAFQAVGYHAHVVGQRGWNGVAILTREPATLVRAGLPGAEEDGARLVAARTGTLTVMSAYVPNGKSLDHPDYARKLAWLARLRDEVRGMLEPGTLLVVGGDFNVAHGDLDTHDPVGHAGALHHTAEERRGLDALLEAGLADLFRLRHPGERIFSWWDYRAGAFHRNLGLRIDLLLGSPAVADALGDVWIDREYRKKKGQDKPSDHAPVIAELR
jgi:exodeoxyribonuclease-3